MLLIGLSGCASSIQVQNKYVLTKRELENVDNICIAGELISNKVHLFDTSKIKQKEHKKNHGFLYQFGALGVVVESLVAEGVASYKLNKKIDSQPSSIETGLKDYNLEEEINQSIMSGLNENKQRIGNNKFNFIYYGNSNFVNKQNENNIDINKIPGNKCNILVVAKNIHGLSVTEKKQPVAIINSEIEIFDTKKKLRLAKRPLTTHTQNESHSILEYSNDNSLLYKNSIIHDAERIGRLIAFSFPSFEVPQQ